MGARMDNPRRYVAEAFGTAWLVFAGCSAALFAAGVPGVGIGFLGVGLAFGLAVITMAYAIGPISGCHLNPAVTIGLVLGGRFPAREVAPYLIAQFVGAAVGAAVLYAVASGVDGFEAAAGFGAISNGYGEHSPGGFGLFAGLIVEVVMTAAFLFIIMGATHAKVPAGFAPLVIGLGLTLIHLASIPVTNTSLNPARSAATAMFAGGWALEQLWLFFVAPVAGGLLGAGFYRWLHPNAR